MLFMNFKSRKTAVLLVRAYSVPRCFATIRSKSVGQRSSLVPPSPSLSLSLSLRAAQRTARGGRHGQRMAAADAAAVEELAAAAAPAQGHGGGAAGPGALCRHPCRAARHVLQVRVCSACAAAAHGGCGVRRLGCAACRAHVCLAAMPRNASRCMRQGHWPHVVVLSLSFFLSFFFFFFLVGFSTNTWHFSIPICFFLFFCCCFWF